ncbi:hypothetical protein CYMTET_14537 [Cymbomonas tetramitiformis]|uniref:Protein kinase domain-containing protein n=1 Tax=Cymbomonas tetramitiformis TaxID=36881 RepID=A0AAE0LAA1_9CHLO|nr:hypothetical protein CYMTET_14537 [Cymbomonas tetramitiformis]
MAAPRQSRSRHSERLKQQKVRTRAEAQREVAMLRALKGAPAVVQLHEVMQEHTQFALILELLQGDSLQEEIEEYRAEKGLPAKRIRWLFYSVVQGLAEMHRRGIVHRNVEARNARMGVGGDLESLKLTDLSRAAPLSKQGRYMDVGIVGRFTHAAPELALQKAQSTTQMVYETAADMWSAGILLCELLTGISVPAAFGNLAEARQGGDMSVHSDFLVEGLECAPWWRPYDLQPEGAWEQQPFVSTPRFPGGSPSPRLSPQATPRAVSMSFQVTPRLTSRADSLELRSAPGTSSLGESSGVHLTDAKLVEELRAWVEEEVHAWLALAKAPLDEAAADLVYRLLEVDPAKRITAPEAMTHRWLNQRWLDVEDAEKSAHTVRVDHPGLPTQIDAQTGTITTSNASEDTEKLNAPITSSATSVDTDGEKQRKTVRYASTMRAANSMAIEELLEEEESQVQGEMASVQTPLPQLTWKGRFAQKLRGCFCCAC